MKYQRTAKTETLFKAELYNIEQISPETMTNIYNYIHMNFKNRKTN